jgi:uncharacterized membrane protein
MRAFSFRPSFSLRGRTFHGLRGWSGKPLHPPLTDIPVAAYLFVAVFDLVSFLGRDETWAREFYRAASFVLIGGAAVSVLTAITGFFDWLQTTEKGTQARRTVNAHAWAMVTVTLIVVADLALRMLRFWDASATPTSVLALSIAAAVLTGLGSAIGGSLVFDYGFNVETAGDHPAWHPSETDVLPGTKAPEPETPTASRAN